MIDDDKSEVDIFSTNKHQRSKENICIKRMEFLSIIEIPRKSKDH